MRSKGVEFSVWWDEQIEKGNKWKEWDVLTSDHTEPNKLTTVPDLWGHPSSTCSPVFDPIATSVFGLCHFYQVGQSGDFPKFIKPCKPATIKYVCCLLLKAHGLVWLNLIIALPQDWGIATRAFRSIRWTQTGGE